LTQGRTTAPNRKRGAILLGQVALVHEAWNDVSSLNRKVVVGTVNVLRKGKSRF
jgi:hypothetical protein